MVLHKRGDMLYSELKRVLSEHLENKAASVVKSNDADFLMNMKKIWDAHTLSMQMIRDILMYMVYFCFSLQPIEDQLFYYSIPLISIEKKNQRIEHLFLMPNTPWYMTLVLYYFEIMFVVLQSIQSK